MLNGPRTWSALYLFGLKSCLLGLTLGIFIFAVGCGRGAVPVADTQLDVSPKQSGLVVSGEMPKWSPKDWPQWRGMRGDGIADAKSAQTTWSDSENLTWSVDIPGRGHSSPVICDGAVYLTTALEETQQQFVLAYDADDGELRWQTKIHENYFPPSSKMHVKSTHANSTVACDGQRVFAVFLQGDAVHATALDLEGNIAWTVNLGAFDSQFGYAPSPVIYKSVLIVPADHRSGGFITAVDRDSDEVVWRKSRPNISSYSSALVANICDQDQLVICGCRQVASYDPNSGEQLWACAATTSGTCGTVVADDENIYASGGFPGEQTARIKADGSGEIVWSDRVKLYEPSLVLTNGLLFGITDAGIAHCWDAESGKEHWTERLGGNFSASPVVIGDLVYVPNLKGLTFVFRATSEGYQEVSRNRLGEGCYASVSVSSNSLFLRAVHQAEGGRVERLHRID